MQKMDLFSEFSQPTISDWETAFKKATKSENIDSFNWQADKNIALKPMYAKADKIKTNKVDVFNNNSWLISQRISVHDVKTANKYALFLLMNGCTSLTFELANNFDFSTLNQLLKKILIEHVNLNFKTVQVEEFIAAYTKIIEQRELKTEKITGFLDFAPLENILINGNWVNSKNKDFETLQQALTLTKKYPYFKVLSISSAALHNSGATPTQEIALVISKANEYFYQLTKLGCPIDILVENTVFQLKIGTSYFSEIAKIKSLRILFKNLVKAYKAKKHTVFINATSSELYQSTADIHNNLLRNTTEAMAAIIGGCDSLEINCYDTFSDNKDKNAQRLAKNIQLILEQEAYFGKIKDPSKGAYIVEKHIAQLSEQSWNLFKEIEKQGGFLKALSNGIIQNKIKQSAENLQTDFAKRKKIMVGVNKYPNEDEKSHFTEKIDLNTTNETPFKALKPFRLSNPKKEVI